MIDAVLAGEGTPDEVVAARGLAVVSDEGALNAAIDEAIAANPDVAAKVREGKVAAVGPLVGAVMKATGGKADAARVRQLILERLSLAGRRAAADSAIGAVRTAPMGRCRSDRARHGNGERSTGAGRSGARRPGRGTAGGAAAGTGRPRRTARAEASARPKRDGTAGRRPRPRSLPGWRRRG